VRNFLLLNHLAIFLVTLVLVIREPEGVGLFLFCACSVPSLSLGVVEDREGIGGGGGTMSSLSWSLWFLAVEMLLLALGYLGEVTSKLIAELGPSGFHVALYCYLTVLSPHFKISTKLI
jgi:hypothetical protein